MGSPKPLLFPHVSGSAPGNLLHSLSPGGLPGPTYPCCHLLCPQGPGSGLVLSHPDPQPPPGPPGLRSAQHTQRVSLHRDSPAPAPAHLWRPPGSGLAGIHPHLSSPPQTTTGLIPSRSRPRLSVVSESGPPPPSPSGLWRTPQPSTASLPGPPHLPWPPKCPRRPLLKPPHPTTGQAVFLPAPGVLLPAWELAWQAPGCTGPARRWGTGDNREADRTRELLEGTAAPRGRTQARMGPDQVTMWRRHLMGTCPCSVQNCSALGTASPLVTSAPPTLPPSTQAHACPRAFAPAARLASSAFPADLLGAPSFSSMLVGAQ